MHLTFEHRLKIFLHLSASHLDQDAHIHGAFFFNFGKVWADDIDLAIGDIVEFSHLQVLETARIFAAKFDSHVILAYNFTFKSRAVGNRNVYF